MTERSRAQASSASVASELRVLVKGGALRGISVVVGALLALATSMLLVRGLGVAPFGQLAFVLGIVNLATQFSTMGVPQGLVRMASRGDSTIDAGSWGTAGLALCLLGSSVAYGACALFALGMESPRREAALVAGMLIVINGGRNGLAAFLTAKREFLLVESNVIVQRVAYLLGILTLVVAGVANVSYVLVLLVASNAIALIVLIPKWLSLVRERMRLSFKCWPIGRLWSFSIPLVLSGTAWMLIQRSDIVILGAMTSDREVGLYAPILRLVDLLFLTSSLLGSYFVVAASSAAADASGDQLRNLYITTVKWTAALTSPLFVMLVSPGAILALLFGSEYSGLGAISAVLVIGYGAHVLTGFNAYLLVVLGKTRVVGLLSLVAVTVNIAFNLILIPRYGSMGAAMATSLALICLNIGNGVALWRAARIHPFRRDYVHLLGVQAFIIVVVLVVGEFFSVESVYYSIAAGGIAVVASLLVLFRDADTDERELLGGFARGADKVFRRVADRAPSRVAGYIDIFREWTRMCGSSLREPWGGPFNGQERRKEIVQSLFETYEFELVVETGTFRGSTTSYISDELGVPIVSIEIERRYFLYAQHRLGRRDGVELLYGDSRQLLERLTQDAQYRDVSVFAYLDAHFGDDLPLWGEVRTICERWPQSVVMIDDFSIPGDPGYGYDDYGAGRSLTMDNLPGNVHLTHDVFWPSATSEQETGARRGSCVLISRSLPQPPSTLRAMAAD